MPPARADNTRLSRTLTHPHAAATWTWATASTCTTCTTRARPRRRRRTRWCVRLGGAGRGLLAAGSTAGSRHPATFAGPPASLIAMQVMWLNGGFVTVFQGDRTSWSTGRRALHDLRASPYLHPFTDHARATHPTAAHTQPRLLLPGGRLPGVRPLLDPGGCVPLDAGGPASSMALLCSVVDLAASPPNPLSSPPRRRPGPAVQQLQLEQVRQPAVPGGARLRGLLVRGCVARAVDAPGAAAGRTGDRLRLCHPHALTRLAARTLHAHHPHSPACPFVQTTPTRAARTRTRPPPRTTWRRWCSSTPSSRSWRATPSGSPASRTPASTSPRVSWLAGGGDDDGRATPSLRQLPGAHDTTHYRVLHLLPTFLHHAATSLQWRTTCTTTTWATPPSRSRSRASWWATAASATPWAFAARTTTATTCPSCSCARSGWCPTPRGTS
jgi:hypothetical protein